MAAQAMHRNSTSSYNLAGWGRCLLACLWMFHGLSAVVVAEGETLARFVRLTSPINEAVTAQVRNEAITLAEEVRRASAKGILVVEIPSGQSEFHLVYGLADFLTSPEVADLTTVAWVPKTVTGYNTIAAISCNEIVMPKGVSLGDIGEGGVVPKERQTIVELLAGRLRNPKVSASLLQAMMNPEIELRQLTIELPGGGSEQRLANSEVAEKLRSTGTVITESIVIKDRGTPGLFLGESARLGDYLVRETAETFAELLQLYEIPVPLLEEQEAAVQAKVRLIEINGGIDTVRASFIKRQLDRAVEEGANLLIFQLETSGGHLEDAKEVATAIESLSHHNIKTVCWAPRSALGPSAIIALACDEIFLGPKSRIGAVSSLGPRDEREAEQEFQEQTMKWLAQRKGRPESVLMAMVRHDTKVFSVTDRTTGERSYRTAEEVGPNHPNYIVGPMLPESGAGLLLLSAQRAYEVGITREPVADLDGVKLALSLPPETAFLVAQRTWVDDLVFLLNRRSMTGLLFFLAFIGLYLEANTNTGVMAILAIICFALYFWSRFLGGTAGSLEVLLFSLGIIAVALEIFVLPGFGVFGVAGGLLVMVSMVMASQTFGSIEYGRDISGVTGTLKVMAASFTMVIVMALVLSRYLPRLPFMSSMILIPPGEDGVIAEETPRLKPEFVENSELVGLRGVTATVLRPAGKAMLQGKPVDVVSDGPYIDENSLVEVIRVHGNNVVVRKV
ncbi:MAG: NfeD family protein [Planctomycetaceae bacterium]